MQVGTYIRPQVDDYGTLLELTADVDVNLVSAVGNLVMAAISGPMGDGGGGDDHNGVSGVGDRRFGVADSFSGGGGEAPNGSRGTAGPGDTGDVQARETTGGGGGGASGGTAGGAAAGVEPAGGEKLPFTGYAALLTAGAGVLFAGAGAALRAKARRRRG